MCLVFIAECRCKNTKKYANRRKSKTHFPYIAKFFKNIYIEYVNLHFKTRYKFNYESTCKSGIILIQHWPMTGFVSQHWSLTLGANVSQESAFAVQYGCSQAHIWTSQEAWCGLWNILCSLESYFDVKQQEPTHRFTCQRITSILALNTLYALVSVPSYFLLQMLSGQIHTLIGQARKRGTTLKFLQTIQ